MFTMNCMPNALQMKIFKKLLTRTSTIFMRES